LIQPEGYGDIVLKAKVGGDQYRELRLEGVLFILTFPINLLSGVKLLRYGGSITKRALLDREGETLTLCKVDDTGVYLQLDSPSCYITALPATL
jgi:hypothetical protein